MLSWVSTIRSRLYLAFGFAASMTVVGSLFALLCVRQYRQATLAEIVSRSMPATVESLRLAEEASTLVAAAPQLMAAEEESQRAEIALGITGQIQMLDGRIQRLRDLDASENGEIEMARTAMGERLAALSQAVTERIKLSAQRRALTLAVRRDHENLLEAITPAIDDANFDLMTKDRIAEGNVTTNQSIDLLRRLLEIQSGANLWLAC